MRYADLQGQRLMALDSVRNSFYDRALAELVTPDTVVMDLGSGIGIFGLLALKHGARHVYAVEPYEIGRLAVELAAANGWEGRLTFIQGRIEEVDLPEKVDLIVSAMTGNVLFDEDLLPIVLCARDRWLKPGGHMLPSDAVIHLAPVAAPRVRERHLGQWETPHLGLDLSPARRYSANAMVFQDHALRDATALGPDTELYAMDLCSANYDKLDVAVELPISLDGTCDGIAGWHRIKLGADWLATGPFDARVHWMPVLFPVDPPLQLQRGASLQLRVTRPPYGEWAWRVRHGTDVREGSTFFSAPIPAGPRLHRRGY